MSDATPWLRRVPSDAGPLSAGPGRTALYAGDRLLVVYSPTGSTRDRRPWADGVWRPGDVPVEDAVVGVGAAFAGWTVSTSDSDLAAALTAWGCTPVRHAHTMSRGLGDLSHNDTDTVHGVSIQHVTGHQVRRQAAPLARVQARAYPPGHPDHTDQTVPARAAEIRAVGRGELLGPLLPVSCVAVSRAMLVGACLVVDREGGPPDAGPWVIDVFRDPDLAFTGVGAALLQAALAAAAGAGFEAMSLAVSHDNLSAFSLYARLGFRDGGESWTLGVPDGAGNALA